MLFSERHKLATKYGMLLSAEFNKLIAEVEEPLKLEVAFLRAELAKLAEANPQLKLQVAKALNTPRATHLDAMRATSWPFPSNLTKEP